MSRLHTHRWGAGPRKVLLLHGICSSGATWWEVATRIKDATVVAPDLRGHGRSPKRRGYSAAHYASDLRTGWDVVVGHSLGGLIAAHKAQDPAFTRRLVLIDPVLEIADADYDRVYEDNVERARRPERERADWHPETIARRYAAARQADPHVVSRTMRENAPWRHRGLADTLPVPTLILGAERGMCRPDLGRDNPRVEFRTILGTGHAVHCDRPDAVLACL